MHQHQLMITRMYKDFTNLQKQYSFIIGDFNAKVRRQYSVVMTALGSFGIPKIIKVTCS